MTLAAQVREIAEKAGYACPADLASVPIDWRREVARKLNTGRYNVDKALVAVTPKFSPDKRLEVLLAKTRTKSEATELVRLQTARKAELEAASAQRRQRPERRREAKAERAAAREARKAAKEAQAAKLGALLGSPAIPRSHRPRGPTKSHPSEKLPQLPAVKLGVNEDWIAVGLSEARRKVTPERGAVASIGQLVRMALQAYVPRALGKDVDIEEFSGVGLRNIGPFRMPAAQQGLIEQVRELADQQDVAISDVVRWALGRWLVDNNYGRGGG